MMSKVSDSISPDHLLSTGSTLLNLACSGRPEGGFVRGHYHFYCGDTDSGKTWLGLSCLAEASINPAFDDYRLIYDAVEGGAMMDMERYFGKRMAKRIEPPEKDKQGNAIHSSTAESFYYHVVDALESGKPMVYVLDSQDSLTSEREKRKFGEDRVKHRQGKDAGGEFGEPKPKVHSAKLRLLMKPLLRTGSILLILNQTRDSFDMFERDKYSGGRALMFYAKIVLWSNMRGKIRRTVKGKKRDVGTRCKIKVKKNHFRPGVTSEVEIPIYYSHGIDDTGSMVRWLVDEGVWTENGRTITVGGLGPMFQGTFEKVVERIESDEGMLSDLRSLVAKTWSDIEKASRPKRKRRYE